MYESCQIPSGADLGLQGLHVVGVARAGGGLAALFVQFCSHHLTTPLLAFSLGFLDSRNGRRNGAAADFCSGVRFLPKRPFGIGREMNSYRFLAVAFCAVLLAVVAPGAGRHQRRRPGPRQGRDLCLGRRETKADADPSWHDDGAPLGLVQKMGRGLTGSCRSSEDAVRGAEGRKAAASAAGRGQTKETGRKRMSRYLYMPRAVEGADPMIRNAPARKHGRHVRRASHRATRR